MTGEWLQKPTPIVEFAPAATVGGTAFSPWNLPASFNWVPLTIGGKSRLLSFEDDRGRNDRLGKFDASTASFRLDNTDGQLDEFKVGSLTEGNKGGSLTPIRFRLVNAYTGVTSTIWTGFITDGWEPSEPRTRVREVTVKAMDWLGWAASKNMPTSGVTLAIAGAPPQLWWRGRLSQQRVNDTSGPANPGFAYEGFAGTGDPFGITGNVGSAVDSNYAEQVPSIIDGTDSPAIRLRDGAFLRTYAPMSTSPPGGKWSFVCVFQIVDVSTYGRDLACARVSSSAGSNRRWRVRVGNTGYVSAELYNAAGASINVATIPVAHNDGRPHLVFATFTAAGGILVRTDLSGAFATAAAGAAGGGGWIGTTNDANDRRCLIQEWSYFEFDASARFGDCAAIMENEPRLDLTDNTNTRLTSTVMATMANIVVPAGFFEPYVVPGATTVGAYPFADNLAEAVSATGDALAGGAWTARDGRVQVYGYGDRSNAYFSTSSATFSNDPATSGAIRYSSAGRSGRRLSRIVNRVTANGSILAQDQASIDQWGLSALDLNAKPNSSAANGYAASVVAALKNPTAELGAVTIRPWGDQVATTWLLETCDLERRVTYVEKTPDNSSTAFSAGLNVQSESWSWSDGTDWTVTLKLA